MSDPLAGQCLAIEIPSPRVLQDFDETTVFPTESTQDYQFEIVNIVDSAHSGPLGERVSITTVLVHAQEAPRLRSEVRTSAPFPAHGAPLYRISDTGASGLGVLATSLIERGQLVMRERPLLVYPQRLPYRKTGLRYAELEETLARMPLRERDQFLSLANRHSLEPSATKGIIDTNSLHLGELHGGTYQYGAVCNDISRINHSCSPNAVYRFDRESFTFEVRALSPIPAGSQVFISYIDPALPCVMRQEALSSYGFTCACTACSFTDTALTQSETRRALIARADADVESRDAVLERWANSPSIPDDFINRVDKMYMDMFEKEQLYYEPVWEAFAVRLCKACCALEDCESARKWATLAAELNEAYTGGDRGWRAVAHAPERTSWWGVRRRSPGSASTIA